MGLSQGGSQAGSEPGSQPGATTPYAGRFVPPDPAELAPQFPQLEILELLGRGGMGAVYKARQPGLDRLVALKILPREVGADPGFAERFTREARALARLAHPHIVMVYDFGQTPPLPSPSGRGSGGETPTLSSPSGRGAVGESPLYYLVMEYVDGVNLRQMLLAGQLQPREALAIVPQICEALQYAHDEGIVHRDIKPENVLVDRKGRVKIADFGLAKLLRPTLPSPLAGEGPGVRGFTLTGTQQVMGTPQYMAPEQIEHPQEVDHRADIYSLGVVFYEMLTGELPIGRFAPPSKKVEVDVRLDEVVLRTLEKEPQRRYQHASEVKTDVEQIGRGGQPAGAPAGPREEPAAAPGGSVGGFGPETAGAAPGSPFVPPPADAPAQADLEQARSQVLGPAIGLLVTGILQCLMAVILTLVLLGAIVTLDSPRHHPRMGAPMPRHRMDATEAPAAAQRFLPEDVNVERGESGPAEKAPTPDFGG